MTRVAITLEQCWHRVPGGTAVAALRTVEGLLDERDLDLVGVSAFHRGPAPAPWDPPIPVSQLRLPRRLLYESWHRYRRPRVESATGPVDVVHATSGAIAATAAPLLATVHDLAFLHHPDHATRQGFFVRSLELVRREAALVVCPSEATADDLEHNGIERDRIRLVPLGVGGPVAADADVVQARVRHGLPDRYVLWVGTIEPRKNVRRLISAFERVAEPGVALALVGPAGWNESIADYEGDPRIRPLGFVPDGELRALYRGASVFCYPSLSEGFGLPVLEAMHQGAPVVTSAGTATAEVAGDAGVLVDPESIDQIAEAIGGVLDDPSRAEELSARGTERAGLFSWDRCAARTADLYRELA